MACWYPFRTDANPLATPPLLAVIVVWIVGLASPFGLVLGIVTWAYIRRSGGWITGNNYSIAAMIVGLLAPLCVMDGMVEIDNVHTNGGGAHSASCMSHVKQLSLGFEMYVQDYDDYFPQRQTWNEAIYPYTKNLNVLLCPLEINRTLPSYALNASLNLYKYKDIATPAQTPMIFDAIPGKNRAGWTEILPSPPRHFGADIIGFVDGHAKAVLPADVNGLTWHLRHRAKPARPAAKRALNKRP
jgi:hypothetical protein